MEELHQPLLAGLAAALPAIGNGLAAVVSYGEAHLYMQQLQAAATAARSRAEAAKAALAEASDGEVKALTDGATAGQKVTAALSDYRRLCGLAGSCVSSAASWLTRHQETLHTLAQQTFAANGGSAQNAVTAGASGVLGLTALPVEWDAVACDRPLMLLGSNTEVAEAQGQQHAGSGSKGILARSLAPLLAAGAESHVMGGLLALLPPELLAQCQQVDRQGQLLLQQQSRLMQLGRWAVWAYAAVLQQLLPGEDGWLADNSKLLSFEPILRV